jgi:PTH1 family peptidyl-tRNA hydrolase
MNSSGQSVRRRVNRYNIKLNDLLVIHDDLDLPLGKIRIRRGGGSGGHKGIDSIIDELESPDFLRLKVGIGRPIIIGGPTEINESEIVDYVLSDLSPNEEETVAKAITLASEAILCLFADGLTVTMNKYN